ncbi:MAG: alpha/beta fold hydrolase, partial [Polyangiaceae bacterium]
MVSSAARAQMTGMDPERRHDRRDFLGGALASLAVSPLLMTACTPTPSAEAAPADRRTSPAAPGSFRSLKQLDAGSLSVGYAEEGPANGPAILLLHGWPYDIHSYLEVTPILAAAGYRVIVPHLRGFG